jgi:hypothetical protein
MYVRPTTIDEAVGSSFVKPRARRYLVISIVMVAALVARDERRRVVAARIAVGCCLAVARRLPALERALAGANAHAGLATLVHPDHLTPLSPIDDIGATADYRQDVALNLVKRGAALAVIRNPFAGRYVETVAGFMNDLEPLRLEMARDLLAGLGGDVKAIVPSTKKVGSLGTRLDMPVTNIDASYIRSHFDGMEVRIHDAPRARDRRCGRGHG